jgi:hypothetical protein
MLIEERDHAASIIFLMMWAIDEFGKEKTVKEPNYLGHIWIHEAKVYPTPFSHF